MQTVKITCRAGLKVMDGFVVTISNNSRGEDMQETLDNLELVQVNSGAGTGTRWLDCGGELLQSVSPIDGKVIAEVRQAGPDDLKEVVAGATEAFKEWRMVPAPKRGEVVRQIGEAMREHKKALGALISVEVGKIQAEAEGEVQEMVDICDFAVGQSRMLYGRTMHSERPKHRMYEQWHPLGPIGVITAFNFPVAVWSWNAMIAMAAGDTVIWKPSSKAPLCAIAVMRIVGKVLEENSLPQGVLNLVIGRGSEVGEQLISHRRIPLISATGSVPMGKHVGEVVAARLGKSILELGGNNAVIVTPNADLDMAAKAIVFGAVGTAGQRCTTTRRVIVHDGIYAKLLDYLIESYRKVTIDNPLEKETLMGPLIDRAAVASMQSAIDELKSQGGRVLYGGEILTGGAFDSGTYVTPCICEAKNEYPVVQRETFAPILYVIRYRSLEEAIAYHNGVPQGLTSAIFTNDLREAETFLSHVGSDCGIANVNIGTSGAEIGGAFGGEKESGGGREAGSDAWKAYMRRQTSTINWSSEMPLAQGIKFELD
ncbi:MAG: aldehyde dehydrogenase family protein [Desulforhabdus sp.]|nr:aldehyde dehydrogenase family protein [Desulforhabdus sp.]